MFYADSQRRDTGEDFSKGNKVLIHHDYLSTPAARGQRSANLSPKWFSLFEIEEVVSTATASAICGWRWTRALCCRVGSILSKRIFRVKPQFLVKWLGYEEPTWEPEENLLDESGQRIVPLQDFLNS